ncbi:tyrosine-type recombinase/integrase [Natronomonas sp. F2-12]|uniref:Tyrosine-type recombinase/integrase n=1 Tax=Natronomonas aquatica TaxID=2841590 RepID=A0A9R1D7E3_9EURY|nr:site-specific integrase [Natronomonas aquatica]MCQ4334663.1 tyrosine-type recombinase/integrase [Natronomonas aquatica]
MTANNPSDLEPIQPRAAQELYLEHKGNQCSDTTVRSHKYRLNYFVEWCDENDIDNMNDLSGRNIHEFRLWRKSDGDLNKISMQTQMSTLRVFLNWCGTIEAVDPDLYSKVLVPEVRGEEEQRDVLLDAEHAEEILQYLTKYHYASREHTLFALLWETGMRIGAVRSLDLRDVDREDRCLKLAHRPDEGTTLKNGQSGERLVAISSELADLLEDYIENTRSEITDDHSRDPLLPGKTGRLSRSTIRRIVYEITAPCYLDKECPGCKDSRDAKCPEAVNPHAIRRGSITHFLTQDVPVEVVGDRMDVSRKVLEKHYDRRPAEVKLEQRRRYLDNI